MRVIPLAAESLGVRSMATFIEAGDVRVLVDPGATLAAARSQLPPTDEEWEALRRANDRISAYAARASVVFVSHYHEDHFRSDPVSYAERTVLLKDPRRMVQGLQAGRAQALWHVLGPVARVEAADGLSRREGRVTLEVSSALAHGLEGTTLGSVVALTVIDEAERERFVFASDVQGPLSPVVTAYLIRQRPTLLYLAGPPSYLERDLGSTLIERGVENLLRIIDGTGCRVIMDHHALRDIRWRERFARLWDTGRVETAAHYLGQADAVLEPRRRELWARTRKPPAKAGAAGATMIRPIRRHTRGGTR